MEHKRNPGFILPLTLGIIALAVLLMTLLSNRGRAFVPASRAMIDREKARMLARSGIEIAMSQLSLPDKKEGESKDKKDTQEKPQETLFSFVIPRLNIWQVFPLKSAVEGMQGEIGVCLMSEEGKLNLNELFDPDTGTLTDSLKSNEAAQKCIDELFGRIQKITNSGDLRKSFEKFLKERKLKLDDVTELLKIQEFASFKDHIFYEPPEKNAKKESKIPLCLTDIFTIWSDKKTMQPWLFSDAMRAVLDLSRVQGTDLEQKKKIVAEIIKTMPESLTWPDGWNKNLKLLYDKDFASLPKGIELLLDTKFEPKIFSVICYGKVGKTTQKVFAILERVKTSAEKDKEQLSVKLVKLYWI